VSLTGIHGIAGWSCYVCPFETLQCKEKQRLDTLVNVCSLGCTVTHEAAGMATMDQGAFTSRNSFAPSEVEDLGGGRALLGDI
jgi:hypothetical protein